MFKNDLSRKNDGGFGIKKDEAQTKRSDSVSKYERKSLSYILKKTIKMFSF